MNRHEPRGPMQVGTAVTELFDDGEFVAVVLDEARQRVHRFSPSATAVWLLCDGRTSIDEIVGELVGVFGTPEDLIRPGVNESLVLFRDEGLLDEPGTGVDSDTGGRRPLLLERVPDP